MRIAIHSRVIRGMRCYTFTVNGKAFGDWEIFFASRKNLCECLEELC